MRTIVKQHECKALQNPHIEIAVQKLSDGHWVWARWGKKRNVADGIAFCPYCGTDLYKEG